MAIKLSGLNSGMDTESIIQELVRAKSEKKIKLEGEQKKLEWKQEKWKELNSKIYSLYSKTLSNMRLQSDYSKKTTKASSTAVTVLTGSNAPNCVQTMKVNQMARAGYLTGAALSDKAGTYTAATKVKDILGTTEDVSFFIESGDKKKEIKITDSTSIKDVLTTMREAGVNANFDEVNQRFYISAKESGKANDFTITATTTAGLDAMAALGIASPLDQDKNTQSQYAEYIGKLKYTADGAIDETATKAALATEELYTKKSEEYKARIKELEASIKNLNEKYDDATDDEKTKITEERAALQTELDELNAKFENGALTEAAKTAAVEEEYAAVTSASDMIKWYQDNASKLNGIRISGADSEIVLNGATYTSDKNTFTINDLTITVNAKTDEEITLTTADDTDGIYDMIKNFFKEYNELIIEMDKLYNADSARKYDMLTDEEREAISEEEAEEWDDKIKGALLRRDSTLGTVFNSMKMIMLEGVKMTDGSTKYLSDFGIATMGYFAAEENERNAYHIDGDEDDKNTSNNTDKLKAAIASDPSMVSEFFAGLTKKLYERLDDLMARTELSSAFTVYNDKALKEEYENYKEKIADQEEKITDFEDRYYDQFSKMEVAMSKLNSQQSALSSLFSM